MSRKILTFATWLLLVAVVLLSANTIRKRAWSFHEQMAMPDELMYMPSNKIIKTMALGFDEVVADYYWLKVIQYFGDQKNFDSVRLKRLYPLLDLITDLAPDFEYVYRFGHISLTMKNDNEDDSIKLLKKGMVNRPDIWQLPYYIGFDYWFIKNQPALAAIFYEEAARRAPVGLSWLHFVSARMMAEASNPDISIMILENMLRQQSVTGEAIEKDSLQQTLKLAYMEKDIKTLDSAVQKYVESRGYCPDSIDDLFKEHLIAQIPSEPHGGEYLINDECKVFSTGTTERLRAYK